MSRAFRSSAAEQAAHSISGEQRDRVSGGGAVIRRIWRHFGLSIVLLGLFLIFLGAQSVAGLLHYNQEQQEHGQPPSTYLKYLTSGHFLEAVGENWESEFLQMGMFVFLTVFLFQKGSAESNDPDHADPYRKKSEDSPWPVRRGGWIEMLYNHSLFIAFLLLFLASFLMHFLAGAVEYRQDQLEHGRGEVTLLGYLGSSRFWFESFQNWQSEFLAILAMVVLSIFLRQKGSPESKDPATPNWENE